MNTPNEAMPKTDSISNPVNPSSTTATTFKPRKKKNPGLKLAVIIILIVTFSLGVTLITFGQSTESRSKAATQDFYADQLATTEPCQPTPGNLLKNPSFESNFKNWKSSSNLKVAVLSKNSPHCKKMLKITQIRSSQSASNTNSISQPMDLKSNTYYKLSFWAKSNKEPELNSVEIIGWGVEYNLKEYRSSQGFGVERLMIPAVPETPISTEWKKIEAIAKSNDIRDELSPNNRFYLYVSSTQKATVFIDNIVLTEIPNPTPTLEPYPTPPFDPTPTASESTQKRVFLTSTKYTGDLDGVEGADRKCQARADAASLGGSWKAWISGIDPSTQASVRMSHNSGQYVMLDGKVFANSWADMIEGRLLNPININEFGQEVQMVYSNISVKTNTNMKGEAMRSTLDHTCNNFTTPQYGQRTYFGQVYWWTDGLEHRWTYTGDNMGCLDEDHLYCFEQ